MIPYILPLITILFFLYTLKDFKKGIGLFFALLPTYLLRMNIFGIPTTLLELLLLVVLIVGIFKYRKEIVISIKELKQNKWFTRGIVLFIIGATIGTLISVDLRAALGEWKAFYIEPILLFIVLLGVSKKEPDLRQHIIGGLLISGLATAALTIYQGFTGDLIAPGYQGRATGWYGYPNGVGLYLGMLWSIILASTLTTKPYQQPAKLFLVAVPFALYFSKSTGALIGIHATIGILFLFYKKTRVPAITLGVVGLILLITLPQLTPIKQELLLQDRSGQIRTHMWSEAGNLLVDKPILGAGMASYAEIIVPYHRTVHGEGIEIFHHPHNIFLTMWVNTGLLGLIGFIMILTAAIRYAWKHDEPFLVAAIVGILVMGLVDSPYIKNDISVLFWTLLLAVFTSKKLVIDS